MESAPKRLTVCLLLFGGIFVGLVLESLLRAVPAIQIFTAPTFPLIKNNTYEKRWNFTVDSSRMIFTKLNKVGGEHVKRVISAWTKKRGTVGCTVFPKLERNKMLTDMFNITYRRQFMEWFMSKEGVKTKNILCYHSLFFDFYNLDEPRWPLYFSIVRDPLERYISHFYYKKKFQETSLRKYVNKDLEYCIDHNLTDCVFTPESKTLYIKGKRPKELIHYIAGIIPFFCGYQPMCRYLFSQEALQEAKFNIERHYQVIGLTEEMNAFFEVLEEVIPAFQGVVAAQKKVSDMHNVGKRKKPVSRKYRAMIREGLAPEYDLYYFIRRRMCRQYKQLFPQRKTLTSCQNLRY